MAPRDDSLPSDEQLLEARRRIAPLVHRTPVVERVPADAWSGRHVFAKCENLQRAGAFKFRGATNAVQQLDERACAAGVAAHSSGNHAAALALAARDRGIRAHLVMPVDASPVKRAAVESVGAEVVTCEPTLAAREATLVEVLERTGATEIHPYDDPRVIAGASTAVAELLDDVPALDAVVAPVGGGGLLSGTALAVKARDPAIRVYGAEPAGADDAARSLVAGTLLPSTAPDTIADGLLTSLSPRTFRAIRTHVEAIVTVDDDRIRAAMRDVWSGLGLVVEPSSAVAFAALSDPRVEGDRVGVIVSGGNVDLRALPFSPW